MNIFSAELMSALPLRIGRSIYRIYNEYRLHGTKIYRTCSNNIGCIFRHSFFTALEINFKLAVLHLEMVSGAAILDPKPIKRDFGESKATNSTLGGS